MKLDIDENYLARIAHNLVKAECGLEGQCENWRSLYHLGRLFLQTFNQTLTERIQKTLRSVTYGPDPRKGTAPMQEIQETLPKYFCAISTME